MVLSSILDRFRIKLRVKAGLTLGKNDECTLSLRVTIFAHDASTKRPLGYTKIGRVSIGQRTFIGAGTILLPNANMGKNVIVGAGSVVTHDIPDNTVALGNPARVVQACEIVM